MTNETIDKILNELKRVERILVTIRETGKLSDIERDIILAKMRTMYEFIQFIQPETIEYSEKTHEFKDVVSPVPKQMADHLIEKTEKVIIPSDEIIELIPDVEAEKPEVFVSVPQPTEIVKPEESPKPIKRPEIKPKTEILAEKFGTKNFLHETLSQYQNTHNLSKKYQHTPLKDIFSAISLNDRFLFIKELFNNDAVLYQKTIEILNSSGDFNEAVRYLDTQFHWDYNESMVQKLLDLIHRRYLPNE